MPKAIRDAAEKRKELPNAKFKVYLVTNLHGVGELQTAVKAAGDKAGIETEIVDGSRLADFLDMNPKGEYVRAHFFGTPVKHVSLDLLKQIGGSSLEQRQARPDFKTATKRVPRAIADVLRDALTNPATGLIWLVASPGKGKSVLAVEAAIAHLNASGFALWLSEEDVNGAETLRQAVDSALRRECPTLEQDAGRQALRLFTSDQRLVLLLDDLNRLSNPAVAFWKVQAWVRSAAATDRDGNGQRNAEMPWTIVCPIWPQYFPKMDRSPGVSNQPSSWEEIVEVPDLSHAEAAMVFSDTGLSVAEMEQAADELGSDPLLCCLAAEEIRRSRTVMPHAVHGVLRRYIDWQLDAVTQATGHPASEYRAALLRLSEAMLRGKNIRPTWTTVRGWIDDSEVCQRLTEMMSTGKAIHCDAASETVLFAHDRFLDEICAECISSLLDEEEVRSEPYFAEIIGRAIAENRLTDVAISRVLADNPLAAFCGFMPATKDSVQQRLAPLLVQWAQTHHNDERLPKTLRWEIGRVLVKTDSPVILELVPSLPESLELHLAALRNGSANYGTNYCRLGEGRLFLPGLGDTHRDAIMDHARSHHAKRLAADLNRDLEQPHLPLEIRRACLLLAGFLGMDEFTPGIERCWQNCPSEEQPNLVAAAFWAIVRCSSQRYGELLTKVLNVWQTIPERGATDREDLRHSIAVYELGQCSPKWMPDQVAQWLAGIVASYPGLAPQLDYLLSLVDAPLAFEYQVRKLAARKSRKGDVSWLSFILQSRWNTNRRHGHHISEPSRQRLHSIWSSPQEPLEEREYAFRYWVISATTAELVTLRTIGPNSHLYQFALRKRMQLRDRTTVNELRTCLLKNWNLLYDAPPVWSPDLQNVVIQLFRCRRGELRYDEAHTAAFLLSLTVEQAELLLVELWPDWGDIVWFQATALLLGTPKAK